MTRFGFSSRFLWSVLLGTTLAGTAACGSESGGSSRPSTGGATAAGGASSAGGSGGIAGADAGTAGGSGGAGGAAGVGGGATVIEDPDVAYMLEVAPNTQLAIAVGEVVESTDAAGVVTVTADISVSGLKKIARYELTARAYPGNTEEQPEAKWTFQLERTDGIPTSHQASFDGREVKSVYQLGQIQRIASNANDEMDTLLGMYIEGAYEESPAVENPADRRWQRHPLSELGLGVLEHLQAAQLTTLSPKVLRVAFDTFAGQIRLVNPEWDFDPAKDWERELFGLDENDMSILISNDPNPVIVQCPFPTQASTQTEVKPSAADKVDGTLTINAMTVNALKKDNVGGLQSSGTGTATFSITKQAQANCPTFYWPDEARGTLSVNERIDCVGTTCCPNFAEDSAQEVGLVVNCQGSEVLNLGGVVRKADATHASTAASGGFSVCYGTLQTPSVTTSVQIQALIGP